MKSKKQLLTSMKLTIDINKLTLNSRNFITSEIARGTRIHKTKKGKGSYTRKNSKNGDYSYECFIILRVINEIH